MDALVAIRSRRTCKRFDGRPLGRESIERLLEAAIWAPTHRLTQPWRFAVLDQAAIRDLIAWLPGQAEIVAAPDPAKGQAKLAKLAAQAPQLGAMVIATWMRDADPAIDLEEHAAAAAAVENLLIAATAEGLGSFWSTSPLLAHPATLRRLGCDPAAEGFLGAIWLGHPADMPPPPPRAPLADRIRWVGTR